LQETTPEWKQFFVEKCELGKIYQHSVYHHYVDIENRPLAGGIAVLSKVPFTEKQLIMSPVDWFPAHLIIAHTEHGDVQILNLHLRPPITPSANPLPLPHVYFTSKYDRIKECKFISQFVDMTLPLIVVGDFNEDEKARSAQVWLSNLHMRSALSDLATTWHWELPLGLKITGKFDHIFFIAVVCIITKLYSVQKKILL